jgi:hypothetical protein
LGRNEPRASSVSQDRAGSECLNWFFDASFLATLAPLSIQLGIVAADDARDTPLVRAVQQSKKSVVNIHTERMSEDEKDSNFSRQNLAK